MSDTPASARPKKILIVRLGAMGDIVHALPAAIKLRAAFPDAQIGWIIEKRWRELLSHSPIVDRIHEVDTRRWRKHFWATRLGRRMAIQQLRSQRYDMAVDFQGAIKSSILAMLSGASTLFGFADPWEKPASLFYTHGVETKSRHVVEQNIELATSVVERKGGTRSSDVALRFQSDPEIETWCEHKIQELKLGTRFAVLSPGAGWGAKQWPADRYGEVARALGMTGIRSLVNYGPGEESLAGTVEQNSDGHAIAASFTIPQLVAVTRRASLFIGGDTGPLHLAAFFRVPVIAIYGPTDPDRNGPYGTRSIVFRDPASVTSHKRHKEAEPGLLKITAAEVIEAARQLLQLNNTGVRA